MSISFIDFVNRLILRISDYVKALKKEKRMYYQNTPLVVYSVLY